MSSDTLKIMVIGLENVGKTSILHTLEKKYSLLGSLAPTKGIERSTFKIFGYRISAWDLGGQEAYRTNYLQKKVFFEDTDLVLFCFDIKDKNSEIALDYYQQVMSIFTEFNLSPPIIVLLHKADPDIKDNPEIRENIERITKRVQELSKSFKIEFFETSIYDEWSLTNAFSYALRKLSTKTEILSRNLADFCQKIMANAIILLNKSGYLIAEYASDESIAFSCQSISTQSMYMFLIMKERGIKPLKITVETEEGFIIFKEVQIQDEPFYLIFSSKVSRSVELFDENFQKFADQTQDIFKFFFV